MSDDRELTPEMEKAIADDWVFHAVGTAYDFIRRDTEYHIRGAQLFPDYMSSSVAEWERLKAISSIARLAIELYAELRQEIAARRNAPNVRKAANKQRRKFRQEIIARDGEQCAKCGATDNLQVDHIYPVSRGGTNDLDNLQLLCGPCNLSKSAKIF